MSAPTDEAAPATAPDDETRPAGAGGQLSELAEPAERGRLSIADRVVEKIAAGAAAEIDATTGGPRRLLGVPVGQADQPQVSGRLHGDEATVQITMSLAWPSPVRRVTRDVRERVSERLAALVGTSSTRVDVRVRELTRTGGGEHRRVV